MTLRLARLGGALVIAMTVLLLWDQGLGLAGQSAPAVRTLGLVGGMVGLSLMTGAAAGPLAARRTRVGLALLAVAVAALLLSTALPQDMNLFLIHIGVAILFGLAGVVGSLVLGGALFRQEGLPGVAGKVLLAGLALGAVSFAAGSIDDYSGLAATTRPLGAIALFLILAGLGCVGFIAMRDRWSWR